MTGQAGHRAAGGVDVALDLGQGDRRLGRLPVGMADRVARVLPALVEQAEPRSAQVLDEAVAVEVARVVDPVERRQRVRPQPLEQRVVAGPGMGLAEQDQPERGRIDRPVVGVVRRLARVGHLAGPQLVEDLAGLGVVPRVVRRRLEPGQDAQRVARPGGRERHGLERGDQAVAPEQRREPRDARGEVRLPLRRTVVAEHRQVGQRAAQRPASRISWSDPIRAVSRACSSPGGTGDRVGSGRMRCRSRDASGARWRPSSPASSARSGRASPASTP